MPRWFPTLHVLRGIAAALVTYLHWWRLWPGHPVERPLSLAACRFWRARYERTVPPYWAALCVAAVVYGTDATAALAMNVGPTFSGAFLGWNMLAVDQRLLPVSWTLGYEWRFYFAFGAVVLLLGRSPWTLVLPWVALLGWQHNQHPYGLASSNLFGLLVGTALGVWIEENEPAGGALWPCLLSAALLLAYLVLEPGWYSEWVYPLVLAPLVLAAVRLDVLRAPTYPRPLTLLGDYSYALYLGHVPAIWLARRWCAA